MFLLAASQPFTKGLVGWRSLPGQGPRKAAAPPCARASAALGAWASQQAGAARTFPGGVASLRGLSGEGGLWGGGPCLRGRGDPALLCTLEASPALVLLPGARCCPRPPLPWSTAGGAGCPARPGGAGGGWKEVSCPGSEGCSRVLLWGAQRESSTGGCLGSRLRPWL